MAIRHALLAALPLAMGMGQTFGLMGLLGIDLAISLSGLMTRLALVVGLPLVLSLWLITKAHAQAYDISLKLLRARLGNTFGGSRASDNRQRLDV